jgi:hypothetical protein
MKMIDSIEIAKNFIATGNDLAKSISEIEAYRLVDSLRERLSDSQSDLDFSSPSLDHLAKLLIDYFQICNTKEKEMSQEEIFEIIRELVSYMGLVLLRNFDGHWNPGENISMIKIDFYQKNDKTSNGGEKVSSVLLLFTDCRTISALQMGIEPKLSGILKIAGPKIVKEDLKNFY